jgi:hypothetical protein
MELNEYVEINICHETLFVNGTQLMNTFSKYPSNIKSGTKKTSK